MAAIELSDEETQTLKRGLTRLRKSTPDRPIGFCFCQEAATGGPVLMLSPPGKKKIPNGEVTALRRTAQNKSRICEGLAWRDPESHILLFRVIHGKFHPGQFKKDVRKLGKAAGVALGAVDIAAFEEKERARLGQELVREVEAENTEARAAADRATTPEARAKALASIQALDERERAEYISGAGTEAEKHAHGLTQRFRDFFSRKGDDPDDGEPSEADRWAFHQSLREDHEEEVGELVLAWEQRHAQQASLRAPWTAQEDRMATIRSRVTAALGSGLPPEEGTALSQEVSAAIAATEGLDARLDQLLSVMVPLSERLEKSLQGELRTYMVRLKEIPGHRDAAQGWQAQTQATLARLSPQLAEVRSYRDAVGLRLRERRQQILRLREDSARLHLSPADIAEEDRLQGALRDAQAQDRAHRERIEAQQKAAASMDTLREEQDRERRDLQRELHDVEQKLRGRMMLSGTRRGLELVQGRLRRRMEALEAGLAATAAEKTAQLQVLQALRRGEAEQEERLLVVEEQLARHRAERQARIAVEADQRLSQMMVGTPAQALDQRNDEAQLQLQRARQTLRDTQQEQGAVRARIAALESASRADPLAGPRVAEAQERQLQARADLEVHRAYMAEVEASLPDARALAADPALAAAVAAKRAAMVAERLRREEALTQAGQGVVEADIRAQAAELRRQREIAEKQLEQVRASGKETTAQLQQITQDIEALTAQAGRDPRDPVLAERIQKLSATKKTLVTTHKNLRSKMTSQGQAVDAARLAEDAFARQHPELRAASSPARQAEQRRLEAQLAAETQRLAALDAQLAAARQAVAQEEATASACQTALTQAVRADPRLQKGLLHADAMAQQEDETAALERLREAQRLSRSNREEALAIEAEALNARARASGAFALLKEAEDIYQAGGERDESGRSMLERLSGVGEPDLQKRAQMQQSYEQVIRASNQIINQVERLKALGEPPERYLHLLDPIPKAFWPDRLVAEAKDYAEIEGLFAEEDRAAGEKKAQAMTLAELAKAGVDVSADTGMVIANVVLCDLDLLGVMGALGKDSEGANLAVDTVQAWQAVSILGAVAAAKPIVEKLLAKAYTMPEGISDVELRKLREELDRTGLEKLKAMGGDIANFLDASDFAVACNKALLGGPLLQGSGVLLPGPGIVFGLINTACKLKVALDAGKKASGDADLLKEMKAESAEDANLQRAMGNRCARSGRLRNEAIVDVVVAGTNTVATVGNTVPGGQVVAAGAWAASATIAAVKAAWTTGIDWKAAAAAKETLKKARLGSRRAMMEIFDHHQKYATMLMLLRARDGNTAAMKFCCTRGLERGEVLDSKASLALLRKLLLDADKQTDDPGRTFQESAARAWDVLSMGARVVAAVTSAGTSEMLRDQLAKNEKAKAEQEDVARRQIQVRAAPSDAWFATQQRLIENITEQARRRGPPCATAVRALQSLRAGLPATRTQWQSLQAELEDTRRWRPRQFSPEQAALLAALPGFLARLDDQDRAMAAHIAAVS